MRSASKTIFLTAFHSFVSKNILNTDVLKILRGQQDLRVIIFVSYQKKDFFEKYYGSENILIEGIDVRPFTTSLINIFFSRIAHLFIDSHYLWYKKAEALDKRHSPLAYIKYFFLIRFTRIFSGYSFVNSIFRKLDYHFIPRFLLKKYFDRYTPSLLFSTDVFDGIDVQFLKEAKSRNVFTVGMIRSWDNCYSKGLMRVIPDKLIVNNEIIKQEAISGHNIKPEDIFVAGHPQFDEFIRGKRLSREQFFSKIGADALKRLVLFAPAGSILSDTDWQICQILNEGLKDGRFTKAIQFFVRNHPHHPADLSAFKGSQDFIFERPGHVLDKQNLKETELDPDETRHLADLLFHSDLVIYVATSLGLDASVFDKPQIIIDFDGWENKPYIKSVKRYHNEDHMKKLIATGGVRVAKSRNELIEWINHYLENPRTDQEGRKKLAQAQLYNLDGKSGERVAHYLLTRLESY